MAIKNNERLQCTVSAVASAGLGAATVSTAVPAYTTFGAGDDGFGFNCLWIEGTAWEVRFNCVYTHSGTSLARGTLIASSTGSAIAFTSAVIISNTPAAYFGNYAQTDFEASIPGGRLTLTSGTPVTTTDVTGASSIYYAPWVTDVISLWDANWWRPISFTQTTLALGTLSSGAVYDVFAYLSGGALALESLAWANSTTRATAVTIQDGRYCKSGDKTRLLLGTFLTTSTTTTEDSQTKRFLINVYNAVPRRLFKASATSSWTYSGTTKRYADNDRDRKSGV